MRAVFGDDSHQCAFNVTGHPFDIAAERILLVEREDKAGSFNEEPFTNDLRKRIKALIDKE